MNSGTDIADIRAVVKSESILGHFTFDLEEYVFSKHLLQS